MWGDLASWFAFKASTRWSAQSFRPLCSPWQLPWPSDHITVHLQGNEIKVNLNCSESAPWLLIYNIRKVQFPYLLAHRQPLVVPMAKWQSYSPSAIQTHLTWCGPWWLLILFARSKEKKIGQGHSIFPASFETSGTNMCRIIVGRFGWRKNKITVATCANVKYRKIAFLLVTNMDTAGLRYLQFSIQFVLMYHVTTCIWTTRISEMVVST